MDFTNEFSVGVGVDHAWEVLTDLERIAPCMPGAELTGVTDDGYSGTVKIKVGPITSQYKGVATFEEQDPVNHTAVLRAKGRDIRGQGNADALITAKLEPDGPDGAATKVTVHTHLNITGKIAQMGRGLIADVSDKLLKQFVTSLEEELSREPAATAPASAAAEAVAPAAAAAAAPEPARREVEALDLMSLARGAVLKRAIPVVVVLVLVVVLLVWLLA